MTLICDDNCFTIQSLIGDARYLLELAGIKPPPANVDHVPMPAVLCDELHLFWRFGMSGIPRDTLHGVQSVGITNFIISDVAYLTDSPGLAWPCDEEGRYFS